MHVPTPVRQDLETRFQEALACYKRKAYGKARKLLLPLVDAGYARAQTLLGEMFVDGTGMGKDFAKGIALWRLAAAQGHGLAFADLGNLYETGLGVAQDIDEARRLYQKAADLGSSLGFNNLGWLCEQGMGGPVDAGKAFELYEKALAIEGLALAQEAIGCLYRDGRGTERDLVQARHWFELAAKQGNADAVKDLEDLAQLPG